MPKKKKKKRKSKAEKRLEKQRKELRVVFSGFDENAVCDDFCEIVETIWDMMIEGGIMSPGDLNTHSTVCGFCVLGWNASVAHDSQKEALQYIDSINHKLQDDSGLASMILKTVVEMKEECCPEHHILIDDATVLMKGSKPVIHVKLDMDTYHEKMEDMATGVPHISEIIDHEALDIALDGVPEDQLEDALSAAIKAQTDDYNNTPQKELGGLTPNEAFQRNRKK